MHSRRLSEMQPIWAVLGAILAIYGLFLTLWLIVPATSAFDQAATALTLWFTYILVVAGVVVLTYPVFSHLNPPSDTDGEQYIQRLKFSLTIAFFLSIVGMALVTYSFVFVLKIDYSKGLAAVYSATRAVYRASEGAIAPERLAGNFLARFYILALGILLVCWENVQPRMRYVVLVSCLFTAAGTSMVHGGRVSLLVAACVVISGLILRKMRGRSFLPGFIFTSTLVVLLTLAFLYSAYVFSSRAERSPVDTETYVNSLIVRLGGEVNDSYQSIQNVENESIRDFMYSSAANLAYAVHVIWTFEEILSTPERPGSLALAQMQAYLYRLGLVTYPPVPHLVSGRWFPLASAIWYDFGGFGLIAIGFLHGIALSLAILFFTRGLFGVVGFGFSLAILAMTILSPMASVTIVILEFMYFGASVLFLLGVGVLIGLVREEGVRAASSN